MYKFLSNDLLNEIEYKTKELNETSDIPCWSWYSYGEKCYAYGVVQAFLIEDEDVNASGHLMQHSEEDCLVDEYGNKCNILENVFDTEHQNGGLECEVACLLRNNGLKLVNMAKTLVELRDKLRFYIQYEDNKFAKELLEFIDQHG